MFKDLLKNHPSFQTVFTLNEIAQIIGKSSDTKLVSQINYYVRRGEIIRLAKGIYALDENYSRKELGNKLRTPSYISTLTVLSDQGVVFQPYTSFFLIANRSEKVTINADQFIYRKIKDKILLNTLGLIVENGVQQASIERAIADKIYLDGISYLDNTRNINWTFLAKLNDDIYHSKDIASYIQKNQEA